jgi:membrane fusion protein, multidrug efflux system
MQTDLEPTGATPEPGTAASTSRRRQRKWLAIVAIAVLILAGLVVWRLTSLSRDSQQTRSRLAGMSQPVGVATIGTRDIRLILNELGTVTPIATVTVQPQLSGQLMEVGFKEGQIVHRGDFLAQIDPRPYQVALSQYQAQMLRDQAVLRQAQTDLERYHALQERDSIAKQTVDDQEWLVKQAEGTVRLDQAQIDAQQLNLQYCHITSPVTGRVGLRQVDVGNYVQPNTPTGLVVVAELSPISVVFTVPEDSVPAVVDQFHGGKPLQVVVLDRANVKQLATGTLGAIDTQVDTTTGTVKMRAMFDNADNILYPQQFVNVQLLVNVLHEVIAAPSAAVQYGSSGPFVYLLTADNTVSVRPVKLGAQDGNWIFVQSGLAAGDRVVTDGADQLRSGARVTVREEKAPAAGDAGTGHKGSADVQPGQPTPQVGPQQRARVSGASGAGGAGSRHRSQDQGQQ